MTSADFTGKPDFEVQLDELDRRIDEIRWKQVEALLKLIENMIGSGKTPAEAIAAARGAVEVMRRASFD